MNIKKNILSFLLILMTENIMATLPDQVYIENLTQAITKDYHYAIDDGKLWFKAALGDSWQLFKRTGLPFDRKTNQSLVAGRRLTKVYADGDIVAVVDDRGKTYLYQSSSSPFPKDDTYRWNDKWGSPVSGDMIIPTDIKGMSIARRSANTIGYMEDRLGNKIKGGGEGPLNEDGEGTFGGLIHLYFLSKDGTEINYADTGLPIGFSYRYSTPLRGRFISENISSSGSIVFLIGETGRMFTRPLDFDMNGNNPMMYDYSYSPIKNDTYDGDNEDRFAYINLPAIPWIEEPQISLKGHGAITRNITMISTGQGNAERELRVQGRSEDGQYGYYYKNIYNDEQWLFKITNVAFDESDILVSANIKKEFRLGPSKDMYFAGQMKVKRLFGDKKFDAEILNYNLVESPAKIRITLSSNDQFDIYLHTVDMWTMQPLDDPGRDGSPKLSFGTIEIPESVLDTDNKKIRHFLEQYLLKAHLAEFRFNVMASKDFVVIESRDGNIPLKWHFAERNSDLSDPAKINGYLAFINKQEYLLEENMSLNDVTIRIAKNRELLEQYKMRLNETKEQRKIQGLAQVGVTVVDNIPLAGWLSEWSVFPATEKMFRWGPALIHTRADLLNKLCKDLSSVVKILEKRIQQMESLLK